MPKITIFRHTKEGVDRFQKKLERVVKTRKKGKVKVPRARVARRGATLGSRGRLRVRIAQMTQGSTAAKRLAREIKQERHGWSIRAAHERRLPAVHSRIIEVTD